MSLSHTENTTGSLSRPRSGLGEIEPTKESELQDCIYIYDHTGGLPRLLALAIARTKFTGFWRFAVQDSTSLHSFSRDSHFLLSF
jgi:hypothetical protein